MAKDIDFSQEKCGLSGERNGTLNLSEKDKGEGNNEDG